MKILIVTPHFWPENFPINEWAKELINHGYKVQVLTGKPNYPGGEIYKKYQPRKFRITQHYYEKIEIISIPIIPRGNGSTFRLLLNYLSFVLSFLIFLPKILNKTDFNVIFYYGITPLTASIPAIILNKIKKKKLLIWVQDLWPESIAFTGHIKNNLLPRFNELTFELILKDIKDHLKAGLAYLKGPQYGLLQKISYLLVIFILLPIIVLTGLTMSPAIAASHPYLLTMFFGVQSARTIHFFASSFLFLFLIIHIWMIIKSGFKKQMLAMTIKK